MAGGTGRTGQDGAGWGGGSACDRDGREHSGKEALVPKEARQELWSPESREEGCVTEEGLWLGS